MSKNKFMLSESTIIICGIVRNCGRNLERNIRVVNRLCDLAKDYHVVIFENDSVDNSKHILSNWAKERKNIHVSLNDYNTVTIPSKKSSTVNPFFSLHRIEKMAFYRNQYLEKVDKLEGDYVVVVDLDVRKICFDGIINSFELNYEWDAIAANGISHAPSALFRKRQYDTYALIECGKENIPQTEESIRADQYKWAFLKRGIPPIRVASAFGGLAIYRREAIRDCRYGVLLNDDSRVECKTEHYFFYKQMQENGYDKVFINPAMLIKYQTQVGNLIRRIVKRQNM